VRPVIVGLRRGGTVTIVPDWIFVGGAGSSTEILQGDLDSGRISPDSKISTG
jgi:hypothetical protein